MTQDTAEQPTPQRLDMVSDLKAQIERIQTLMKRLDSLDDLAKADILAHLYPIIKPGGKGASETEQKQLMGATKKPVESTKPVIEKLAQKYGIAGKPGEKLASLPSPDLPSPDLPERGIEDSDHMKAALHHATWWAGHQGEFHQSDSPDHHEQSKRHLALMMRHLDRIKNEEGRDIRGNDSGPLIKDGQINPAHHLVWGNTSEFGQNLLDAALSYLSGDSSSAQSHIQGREISKFGPGGIFSQRKTPSENLKEDGHHPLDVFVPSVSASDYGVKKAKKKAKPSRDEEVPDPVLIRKQDGAKIWKATHPNHMNRVGLHLVGKGKKYPSDVEIMRALRDGKHTHIWLHPGTHAPDDDGAA